MHKAQIVSPILDMQVKQKSYKKHMDTLVAMKPVIDTSKPPPNPRLELYKKRMTRERLMQLQAENENIKMIKNNARQRNKTRKAYRTNESFSDDDFIEDWEDQLDAVDIELGSRNSNERPAPLLSDPNKSHSVKNIINDDGMEVVDENVVAKPVVVKPLMNSSRKRAHTSRSGLRRLNPLKKTLNHKHDKHLEEEDYNDNDIDDDDENYNADLDYYKNSDINDNKYSSDSSRSLSGDENTSDQITSERRRGETDDEDSFDRYDKVSESVDRDGVKSGRLLSDDFESSSDSDHETDKDLSRTLKNDESITEEMQNKNLSSDSDNNKANKNDDGFDNFENLDEDEPSKENIDEEKSDNNLLNESDDDLNMGSIPEF